MSIHELGELQNYFNKSGPVYYGYFWIYHGSWIILWIYYGSIMDLVRFSLAYP